MTYTEFYAQLMDQYRASAPNGSTPRRHVVESLYDEHIKSKSITRFSVDLLDGKYCTQLRRQYEPQGFTFDTRRHNRFQKWTIIGHPDGAKLASLRKWLDDEGYETDNERPIKQTPC